MNCPHCDEDFEPAALNDHQPECSPFDAPPGPDRVDESERLARRRGKRRNGPPR